MTRDQLSQLEDQISRVEGVYGALRLLEDSRENTMEMTWFFSNEGRILKEAVTVIMGLIEEELKANHNKAKNKIE